MAPPRTSRRLRFPYPFDNLSKPPAGARSGHSARDVRCAGWSCRAGVLASADRFHSGAGPGIPDHHRSASSRSDARATEELMKQATDIILNTHGIEHVAPFAGLDATTSTVASNSATIFSSLPSLYNHEIPGVNANTVLVDLRERLSVIKDARVLTIPPPPVQGIGSAGGFKMMLENRAGLGWAAVFRAANDLVAAANN